MSALPPLTQGLSLIRLQQTLTITASGDSIVTKKVPFNCVIVKMYAGVEGIDDATALSVDLENGAVDVGDPIVVATGSAIVAGGVEGTPDSGQEALSEGDVLHMDVDITGGSSPDIDGCWVDLWVARVE